MENARPTARAPLRERFRRFAHATADRVGAPWAFFLAVLMVVSVFLIQNTQNRDAKALHLKLDELIRALEGARNKLVALEEMTDDELAELQEQFKRLHERHPGESQGSRAA